MGREMREEEKKKRAVRARAMIVCATVTLAAVCGALAAYGGLALMEARADQDGGGPSGTYTGSDSGLEKAGDTATEDTADTVDTADTAKTADAPDTSDTSADTATTDTSEDTAAPDTAPPDTGEDTAPPETAPPETAKPVQVEPIDVTAAESYVFGTALEQGGTVEDTYFDNAVFLGDSRTEGLMLYSGLTHGDFLWHRGMSVFHADSAKYRVVEVNGEKYTLTEALARKQYGAVYLMLGINELGYSSASYETTLAALVDRIQKIQPEAVVYLQTLMPVNDVKVREKELSAYINNENVEAFNRAIVRVAKEKRVVLLDTASLYRGEDGQLPAELTADGVHFTVRGYGKWADYLRCHVMDRETYFALRGADEKGTEE